MFEKGKKMKVCLLAEQVWTQAARPLQRLVDFPLLDFCLMAREEYVGHFPALVVGRAGIDRRRQQVVLKRVVEGALLVTQHARHQAYDSVGHSSCGELSASQDEVAETHFLGDEMFANAVVDTLVVPAQNDEVLRQRKAVGHGLVEAFAVGCGKDDLVVVPFRFQCRYTRVDRLAGHDHSGKASEGIVVDAAVTVGGVIAQVVHVDFSKSLFLGTAQDGSIYEAVEHLGQYGNDVYAHGGKEKWQHAAAVSGGAKLRNL